MNFLSKRRHAAGRLDRAVLSALSRSQAIIEFDLDGTILEANENFLRVVGYERSEVVGQHHRMFAEPEYAASAAYQAFWSKLRRGEYDAAEYRRIAKGGREIWIQASYNPVLDDDGKPVRVVKVATDVTAAKLKAADVAGQIAAISKSQAVIEFDLEGNILTANPAFCAVMGYRLEEIAGRHHSMFVLPGHAGSAAYRDFWARLRRGEFQAAEYERIGNHGRPVWVAATYNPILDMNGRPFKVVKFATDVTARKAAVAALGEGLARLAGGDLSSRIEVAFDSTLEGVRTAFNDSVTRFGETITQLRETSRALRTATGEILSGSNNLGERTSKTASAIQEASSAMEQLASTVAENATRAAEANTSTQRVSETAAETGDVMRRSNEAMSRISSSSSKISGIIGLIDDIAFQTNLLALNASVEAARAGDAGKGFAVVAIEVRRLAQSAAGASAEVKQLVEQSAIEVAGGSRLVSDAATKLEAMLDGIRQSAALVDGIARATGEQSGAIREISTAIREMDQMTQHNAALVEETNAAIEQTEGQAAHLDKLAEAFVVAGSAPPAQARRMVPRASTFRTEGNAAISADWDDL
jgi:methyl-accepting chemotaxis protein